MPSSLTLKIGTKKDQQPVGKKAGVSNKMNSTSRRLDAIAQIIGDARLAGPAQRKQETANQLAEEEELKLELISHASTTAAAPAKESTRAATAFPGLMRPSDVEVLRGMSGLGSLQMEAVRKRQAATAALEVVPQQPGTAGSPKDLELQRVRNAWQKEREAWQQAADRDSYSYARDEEEQPMENDETGPYYGRPLLQLLPDKRDSLETIGQLVSSMNWVSRRATQAEEYAALLGTTYEAQQQLPLPAVRHAQDSSSAQQIRPADVDLMRSMAGLGTRQMKAVLKRAGSTTNTGLNFLSSPTQAASPEGELSLELIYTDNNNTLPAAGSVEARAEKLEAQREQMEGQSAADLLRGVTGLGTKQLAALQKKSQEAPLRKPLSAKAANAEPTVSSDELELLRGAQGLQAAQVKAIERMYGRLRGTSRL